MMSLHHQLYICVLCVINLTMCLPEMQLQVPCLLVDLRGTNSSVVSPFCTHIPQMFIQ